MIEPKKPNVDLSIQDCIVILENIRERGKAYDEHYPLYSKEYCEQLAGIESLAIEKVILILKNQESQFDQSEDHIH